MKFQCAALLAAASILLTGCAKVQNEQQEAETQHIIDIAEIGIPDPTQPETEPPPQPSSIRFLAVGDNLIHSCVYHTAENHADSSKSYDFHYCYQYIQNKVKNADLAFINQETVICNDEYEISGSNLNFNSPVELGYDLIDVGFDIF